MQVPRVHAGIIATEHIGHNDLRRDRTGGAQRQVEHRPQVLLELRRRGPLDGPVPAVVRPHRQLVDQQRPTRCLEQLHRQQAGDIQFGGELQRQPLGLAGPAGGQPRRRRQHLVADAVALDGLHDRVDGGLAVRGAGDQHGQFPVEADVLLGEHRDRVGQHLRRLVRRLAHPHPAPVVAAADRLQHHRPARLRGERRHPRRAGNRRVARAGHAETGQPLPHRQLVLGVAQRGRARADRRRAFQRGQMLAGDVLVVEGDHVALRGEGQQVGQGCVVPDPHPGADLRGAVARRAGQHPEPDAEADRRLAAHPRQLARADHPHHGGRWPPLGLIRHAP